MIGTWIKQPVESEAIVHVTHSVFNIFSTSVFPCFSVSVQFVHFGPEKPYLGSGQLSIHPHKNVWNFDSFCLWHFDISNESCMYDFCKDVLIHVWCCVPDGSNFYRFSVWNFQQNSKPCPFLLLLFQELKNNHSNNMLHNPEKWNNSSYQSFFFS